MMTMKLVCECSVINDSDALYCKTCGKAKDVDVGKGITKLAELAKLKTTFKCYHCGCEVSEAGTCSRCKIAYLSMVHTNE